MAKDKSADSGESQGQGRRKIVLPNGEMRVNYIRRRYYDETATRSEIRKELSDMTGDNIAYQIVFAATKTKEKPVPKVKMTDSIDPESEKIVKNIVKNRESGNLITKNNKNWENESFNATVNFALAALRGVFIANGVAIIAILTFLGNSKKFSYIFDNEALFTATKIFLFGIGAAILATGCSYLSQSLFTKRKDKIGKRFLYVAILSFSASLSAFMYGAFIAAESLYR